MSNYSWTVSPAGTPTGGGTSSSSSVTVTWNTALPGQYVEVNYFDTKGCTSLTPAHFNVTVNATPALTVTGNNALCAGSNNIPYTTSAGMNLYAWSVSAGGTLIGPVNTNAVNVNWNPAAIPAQSVTVSYTNSLGCSGSTIYPVTIHPLPVSTFTGTTTVCQLYTSPYSYPANSGPACSYTWSLTPSSYGSITNPLVSPAAVTWNTTGQATLRLDAITGFNCSSFSTQTITINPRPDVSITPCFDLVTNRSAKRFLLKGGIPLLTSTPLQGEYMVTPATSALVFTGGNYYFDPSLVSGTSTTSFAISYKYTSSQYGCPATSPSSVTITVRGANPACTNTMTDYRDTPPTTYRTTTLAGKCWMLENLRFGSPISYTTPQADNCTVEKYCLSTDPSCTAYGALYQWDELIQFANTAAPDYQGVCPPGWHVPSQQDWQDLIDAVAAMNPGDGLAGSYLKDPNPTLGFHALLEGILYLNNTWAFNSGNLNASMFWTSTPSPTDPSRAIVRGLNSEDHSVSYSASSRANAFPIRCIRD